jgi:hypothetical protein
MHVRSAEPVHGIDLVLKYNLLHSPLLQGVVQYFLQDQYLYQWQSDRAKYYL